MKANRLKLKQLEDRLRPWRNLPKDPISRGWLRTIREALGMGASVLAERLDITRQALSDLEEREREGNVTIDALRRAAEQLDCDVIYAIVPRQSLTAQIEAQARKKAVEELERIVHTMQLESQGTGNDEIERLIEERTSELMLKRGRQLWQN